LSVVHDEDEERLQKEGEEKRESQAMRRMRRDNAVLVREANTYTRIIEKNLLGSLTPSWVIDTVSEVDW